MSSTHYRSCPLCEACCGLTVEADPPRVLSIRGDEEDPLSQGHICPKALGLKDIYEDPDRLRTPLKRVDDDWDPIGWDEAFDLVAHRLKLVQKAYGRDAIGVYQGNPSAHSLDLLTFGQLFLRRLGTRNLYSATSADQLPHMLSSLLMFGNQLMLPVPDIDRTQLMLMIGANPLVSNGSVMTAPGIRRRLRDLRERGGKLIVIDPRHTETAAIADRHLFIRPGTDALLLLALLHTIYDEDRTDLGRLKSFTGGARAIRTLVRSFSPETVAGAVGIAAEEIRALAVEFAEARTAVCYARMGASTQEFGGLCSWLVNVLNIVTGNFDRAGGAMFTTPAVDVVAAAAKAGQAGTYARWRSRASGLPEFGGELPVSALAEEIETPGSGQIHALIVSAGNPVLTIPNGPRLERALAKLDFVVAIDFYLNETSRHADVILPPTSPLEHDHYDLALAAVAVRNFAKYSPPLFERGPDQRHDWEIALELASRMETTDRFWGRGTSRALRVVGRRLEPRRVLDLGLRVGPYGGRFQRGGLTLRELEQRPHGVDLGPLRPRLPAHLATADKRLDLAPTPYLDDIERLRATLDEARAQAAVDTPAAERTLQLIGRRHLRSNNSWMHNCERLVKGKPRCTLLIHPEDAQARGLANGDTVEIASRVGSVRAPAEVSDEIMPGVVSLPHGWGHHRAGTRLAVASEHAGVSANDVTDERFVDEMSGTCAFSGVPVTVRATTK